MQLSTLTLATWTGLLATPLLIALGQVLFKLTSQSIGTFSAGSLMMLAINPVFIAALALYGFGTVVWIYVLRSVPLTIAYSFMGLTFCFVPLLAQIFFGEPLHMRYLIGTLLILAGLVTIHV
ncbi:EamA family transporter [Peteryoungia algae]|jgi:undecaprenyl phosphate-alpha-L-ara4N flippase subunit ArnE|uniref:Transporter n=1 Tax=Peteryoungia algae TaxID=2919917 RepID=A0ABT0CUZ8_9HYPH|nr:transporter [Rhizobium sp. SSM4.3]MCJ8236981.1 transporter [Rhizobium sp. SSM4.3]